MKTVTKNEIISWGPCKPYTDEIINELFDGREQIDVFDVACLPISEDDKLWIMIHMMTRPLRVIFACECAERAIKASKQSDPRSLNAIEVARKWTRGEASKQEAASASALAFAADSEASAAASAEDSEASAAASAAASKSAFWASVSTYHWAYYPVSAAAYWASESAFWASVSTYHLAYYPVSVAAYWDYESVYEEDDMVASAADFSKKSIKKTEQEEQVNIACRLLIQENR